MEAVLDTVLTDCPQATFTIEKSALLPLCLLAGTAGLSRLGTVI